MTQRHRAPRNRTVTISPGEREQKKQSLLTVNSSVHVEELANRVINQNMLEVIDFLPECFVDLLFLDPPYNLDKKWNDVSFRQQSIEEYARWMDSWLGQLIKTLKPSASVYICGDWQSSTAIHEVAQKYLTIRNRITWEREKGRGSKVNWKNNSEDIWFCTVSDDFFFNTDAVKLKRRVIAPYTDASGEPKDWTRTDDGGYRLTHPSNLWTDVTVPFWSMPENTDHPTQKPEKLLAKIMLASSKPGDLVFDPFLGSGTAAVVAKKLGRQYVGIEVDELYCCLALKRLDLAETDNSIQGYSEGVFWERNTLQNQGKAMKPPKRQASLF